MKYVRRGLYIFIPLLLCLFALRAYISTNNFRDLLTNILKNSGLNVTFEKVELQGFNKLKIDNLIVRDIHGNVFINSKKTTANINLLVPSRLNRIDVYDAIVNIERQKNNHMNVFDIMKPSNKKNSIDRASRLGKLYIHNATVNYSDVSYAKKIEKTLNKVNGFLETAKSRGFTLEAKGSNGNEVLGIKLRNPIKRVQNFWSIFNKKKNNDEKEKHFEMTLDFKNVKITELLGQYVPLDMIKAKSGILDGRLFLSNKNPKKETIPVGNLKITNGTVWYEDIEGDIKNVDATVILSKDKNTVDAKTKLKNRPVTFKLTQDRPKEKLKIKLTADKLPYSEINRYKIIKEFKVDAIGNVTADLDIDVDLKTKNALLNGIFSSENIKLANYNFRNVKTKMKLDTKEKIVVLDNTKFNFDETISGFKVKADAVIPKFTYNTNTEIGSGNYILTNRGSDFSIKEIAGTALINSENIITSNFNSKEVSGNFRINPKLMEMVVNAKSNQNFDVIYQKQKYTLKPKIENLKLAFKNKNILQSGRIKTDLKIQNKYVDNINADVIVHNGNYDINALVTTGGEVFRVAGKTTSDMKHNYTVELKDKNKILDVAKLLKNYKVDIKGLETARLPIKLVKLNIFGDSNKISGDYEISSAYGRFIVEYEELHAKGKIHDLQKMDLDMNAKMKELWIKYQRFKEVSTHLAIKDNVVNIEKLGNDRQLVANGKYNLKTGNMHINSKLNNYVVYNTVKPELNLYINNANLTLNGKMDNLSGKIIVPDSRTTINDKNIGETQIYADIKNSVINLTDVRLRKNNLTGTYNLKTGIADMVLNLDEENVPYLIDVPDLKFGAISKLKLKGDLNKFNLAGFIDLNNVNYKGYNIPGVKTIIEYADGNIDKLLNYGTLDIKDFRFIGDNQETLFQTNTKVDLANTHFNYKLENQKFALDSVEDLKNKGYSGDINLNFSLTGKPNNFNAILGIGADDVTLSGFHVKDLVIDASASNKLLNIGQISLEYEDNPLVINGYLQYEPMKYNLHANAENFNLSFLGLDPNIKTAEGILNMDMTLTNAATSGKIDLANFSYITKDGLTNAQNINAKIDVANNKLQINRLDGGFNGGTFIVDGNMDIPTIPGDFMKTKHLELGKIDIDANLDKLGLRYGNDIDYALTGKVNLTEDFLSGNLKVDSADIRGIPNFGGNEEENLTESQKEQKLKDKTIAEGIIEGVIDKILKQYTVALDVQMGRNVKVDIPSMSLVKNIKSKVDGGAKIRYENGAIGMDGTFSLRDGKFYLNGNRFKIDSGEIRFISKDGVTVLSDPFVIITASTTVKGEKIEVDVSGNVSNPQMAFSSSSGKTKEEILSLLAFKTVVGNNSNNHDDTSLNHKNNTDDGVVVVGSLVNTALNELIFSSVTGKIGESLGLSNFSISTDVDKSKTGQYRAATTLYVQDNLYKDKLFWNLEVKFPFQVTKDTNGGNSSSLPVGYNAWLNYNFNKSLELKVGGETINQKSTNANMKSGTKGNYYIGVDFSTRGHSLGEILKRMFKKKKLETLKK